MKSHRLHHLITPGLATMALLLPGATHATMAVLDVKNWYEAKKILTEAEKQLWQLQRSYHKMTESVEAIKGYNHFGDFLDDRKTRKWMAGSIEEINDMVHHGYNPGVLGDRINYYKAKFPSANPEDIDPYNPDSLERAYYTQANTQATYHLAATDHLLESAHAAHDKTGDLIDKTHDNDTLKQSADLNNTLLLRNIELQQSLVELQTAQLHTAALSQQYEASQIANTSEFFADPIPELSMEKRP